MGIDPIDTVHGNDCLRCFAEDETPEMVLLFTSGIMKSPYFPPFPKPPPNGYVYCHQTANACEWEGHNETFWRAFVQFRAAESCISIEVAEGVFAFNSCVHPLCHRFFTNAKQDPMIFGFYGGNAVVMLPEELIEAVESITEYFPDGARFDVTPGPGPVVDVRYANRKHRQNIIIQIPPP